MIETKCPICWSPVTKISETDENHENGVLCSNEYYVHYVYNDVHKLVKFKTPHPAWEATPEYKQV